MGKTLVINMEDVELKGDILDVGEKNLGVIYNLSKDIEDELSLDYIDNDSKIELKDRKYDACTFFFELNHFWTNIEREKVIRDVLEYLKDDGEILIWDINKERGKIFNNKIKVILPRDSIKEFTFKNINLLSSSNLEEIKKILEKYFKIEETKTWEDIFFIKGKKLNEKVKEEEISKNEGVTYSS
ncbi:hypothetical protein [Clostridium sp. SM-530-WT-3G]|uniref:hypothetical protein n=1 Tax=Clostridium sp. SM-530-WT-3G TaxID=2725303 RepID=UPI00145CCE90|nr:hypothetical protein [Clostridium sp. SM-530-WT-3G]NME82744.1 hypothetical protein [Clostridium sp. SM-530-WT-3G]